MTGQKISLEKALKEYRRRREEGEKKAERLKREYNRWLSRKKKELLKKISALEKKKPPKKVDERLLQRVEAERKAYVSALRRALESIEDIEDLGKRLSDLSKLHVSHGRHVMVLYEKEVYAVNALLKELSEGYSKYVEELSSLLLPEIELERVISELRDVSSRIGTLDSEINAIEEELEKKKKELDSRMGSPEIEEIKKTIESLRGEQRRIEIEVRSKVSKLGKPLRRMRLGGLADEVARDSGVALERPGEFLSLLRSVYPKLDGKAKKAADWLLKNLSTEVERLGEISGEIETLKKRRKKLLEELKPLEEEIRELKRILRERKALREKLERKRAHLEGEIREEKKRLEDVIGVEVEG
ncbi:hypothetical protein [Thermococcus sp.]|uniref:hypothetical protein n=1 Tax=Thermococcus sp. TaxID=35749 RepID=UPI002633BED0|nr:hypothetical protein [Thermococcus sp.]